MSFVTAAPEIVASAASDLASIGSTIGEANAAAATPTTGVLPAAADEVSAGIASLFGSHAQAFQALSTQAASFHQQFVQLMTGSAAQYASAEAANTSPMTTVTVPSFGYGNTGTSNVGFFNTGTNNFGIGNTGNYNLGIGNTGSWNFGIGNFSPNNLNPNLDFNNPMITALGGIGIGNTGFNNIGIGNAGNNNTGLPISYLSLLGGGNNGSFNAGLFNFGSFDTGIGNTGSNLYGIGLIGNNQFGIGPLSIPYPFPPLPLGIPYPFGLS
jgi:PPE-repeat protein